MSALRCLPGHDKPRVHDGLELSSQRITTPWLIGSVRRRSTTSVFSKASKRVHRVWIQCAVRSYGAHVFAITISDPHNENEDVRNSAPLFDPSLKEHFGYNTNIAEKYSKATGARRGGLREVILVRCKETKIRYACKSIRKIIPDVSKETMLNYLASIAREVDVLRALSGSLSVTYLLDVFEDERDVHIVMEYCCGAELKGKLEATERVESTVVRYVRAMLQTLAQCHSVNILHRDVKPGNFMFLNTMAGGSPIKGIDFGMARWFNPAHVPLKGLELAGTPWYISPEVLSANEVGPHCDVWSVGISTYQMLMGEFPFEEHPSISQVWKSICRGDLKLSGAAWDRKSELARDFMCGLLHRDVSRRLTALEALSHPWLQGDGTPSWGQGPERWLVPTLLQRIQRFLLCSPLKRKALGLMAENLAASQQNPQDELSKPSTLLGIQDQNLVPLLAHLGFSGEERLPAKTVAKALVRLGFVMGEEEAVNLLAQLDPQRSGELSRSQVAVALLDFDEIRRRDPEAWALAARSVFQDLDRSGAGCLAQADVAVCIPPSPQHEVDSVFRWALAETGTPGGTSNTISFEAFLQLLQYPAHDTLLMFDSRYQPPLSDDKGGYSRGFVRKL